MTDELKPCPFCGAAAIRCENFTGLPMFWTQCGSCHACPGGDQSTREEADAAWNTRSEARDEARHDAWSDFEDEYLTDGQGYAAADVYKRCREAFDAAWPEGRDRALKAAILARSEATRAPVGETGEIVAKLAEQVNRFQGHPDASWSPSLTLAQWRTILSILAAAPSPPVVDKPGAGEAVAWRFRNVAGGWTYLTTKPWFSDNGPEIGTDQKQALYTRPSPPTGDGKPDRVGAGIAQEAIDWLNAGPNIGQIGEGFIRRMASELLALPAGGEKSEGEKVARNTGNHLCGSRDEPTEDATAPLTKGERVMSFDEVEDLHSRISGIITAHERFVWDEGDRWDRLRSARRELAEWLEAQRPDLRYAGGSWPTPDGGEAVHARPLSEGER